jgi:hypothetical protein
LLHITYISPLLTPDYTIVVSTTTSLQDSLQLPYTSDVSTQDRTELPQLLDREAASMGATLTLTQV